MQRLSNRAEGHGLVAGLQAKHSVHRARPVHVAAGEVPTPNTAAGQRLGQLSGKGAFIRARGGWREIPQAAGEEREHQAGQDQQRDFETGGPPPVGQRSAHRLDECQLRVGLVDIAHGDDGVSAVEQRQAQHAGFGAERGQGLLRT
jgi:hypothetical protein